MIYIITNKYIKPVLMLLTAAAIITGCKKEIKNVPYPYAEITAFKVTESTGEHDAAVAGNELVIYWPSEKAMPDSVSTGITVSEHASVKPESGKKVALKTGVVFTVTAEDGTVATYKLKIVVNQPPLSIGNLPDDFQITAYFGRTLELGSFVSGVIPNADKTSLFLISAAGVETKIQVSFTNGAITGTLPAKDVLAAGTYKFKIISGVRNVISNSFAVKLTDAPLPPPRINYLTNTITVKAGETFTVTGTNLRNVTGGFMYRIDDFSVVQLEVVSFTTTSIVYRIPAVTPAVEFVAPTGTYQNEITQQEETFDISPDAWPAIIVTN
jgi:hypothetical protein